jgi:signal transduction histidine kinase
MFKKTRTQLTLLYAGIIGLILVIMALFFYFVLSAVLHKNENDRLSNAAQQALLKWTQYLQKKVVAHVNTDGHELKMEWEYIQADQFGLIVGRDGQIVAHSLKDPNMWLLQVLPSYLTKWVNESQKIKLLNNGETLVYSVSRYQTNDSSQSILYIGLNVSDDVKLLIQMKFLLIISSFVLLVVASVVGYIFAGRAIIPIKHAFKKQQEFTANASHELRTPLSVLQASIEIIEEEKKRLPTLHQSILGSMKDEIRRMIQLAEHLLTLARFESKQVELHYEAFDLHRVIKLVVDKLQIISDEKKIKLLILEKELSRDDFFVGNENQIYQLIYILMDNAIKHSAEQDLVTIQCKYLLKPNRYEIIVSDQGGGIPKEDLPQIFERFYRVDKARSRDSGGTGLGLSIAASIVQIHSGEITVESALDKGSIFRVSLPILMKR